MQRIKSIGDAAASVWGLGIVPGWLVLRPDVLHEITEITSIITNVFAILASIFTVVWTVIRIGEYFKRRKAWKRHKFNYKK